MPDGGLFIYKWNPFQVGRIENDVLVITHEQKTNHFFSLMRGSSNIAEYKDTYITITHCVFDTTPRKYYHHFVTIDKHTNKILRYSLPFYFQNDGIEYCLGIIIKDNDCYAFLSQFDSHPILVKVDLCRVKFYDLFN
jgi:hypothetical protein